MKDSKRNYNVFFNTHTVSGIVISVALYIIFFAGAFTIFEEQINDWEFEKEITPEQHYKIDYDRILTQLIDDGYHISTNDVRINMVHDAKPYIRVMVLGKNAHDSIKGRINLKVDPISYKHVHYSQDKSTSKGIWKFIYRLHFLDQIPTIGIYLAGLVSLFFLFAIVTGIIVHWKKIIPNFFDFRPWAKFKTIWTDAHTVLGVIGIPFQLIYAITGAFYALSVLLLAPSVLLLFDGNQEKLLNVIGSESETYEAVGESAKMLSVNSIVSEAEAKIGDYEYMRAIVKDYGDKNANLQIIAQIHDSKKDFIGAANYSYNLSSGALLFKDSVEDNKYNTSLTMIFSRLHFVSYGGIFIKIIYFLLALITCFVIITGVLIWLKARDKKTNSIKQKKFINRVGAWYMGVSLGILPAIALLFILAKTIPISSNKDSLTSTIFFSFWAAFLVYSIAIKDTFKINKMALLIAGIFGVFIPIINGITSGYWIWTSINNRYYNMLTVDLFWLLLGSSSFVIVLKLKRKL